jgi:hypothetical protein
MHPPVFQLRTMRIWILGLSVAFGSGNTIRSDDQPSKQSKVAPLATLAGSKSGILKEEFIRVESGKEFEKIWRRHQSHLKGSDNESHVQIDFAKCTVVAIFNGQSFSSDRIIVQECIESDAIIRLVYRIPERSVGEEYISNQPTAYCFIVLPKTTKKITVVEEDRDGRGKTVRRHRADLVKE